MRRTVTCLWAWASALSLGLFVFFLVAAPSNGEESLETLLDRGIRAFEERHFPESVEYFRKAKALDPTSERARLYLGVAYMHSLSADKAVEEFDEVLAQQPNHINARLLRVAAISMGYIPGPRSNETVGKVLLGDLHKILETDPNNLEALEAIGGLLYWMGASPYDETLVAESKRIHMRRIQLRPEDPQPYYWVGYVEWVSAWKANRELRNKWNYEGSGSVIREGQPLPDELCQEFARNHMAAVDNGIRAMRKALALKPDYAEALLYLNLLYHLKVDQTSSTTEREQWVREANEVIDRFRRLRPNQGNVSPINLPKSPPLPQLVEDPRPLLLFSQVPPGPPDLPNPPQATARPRTAGVNRVKMVGVQLKIESRVEPEYPPLAKVARVEGTVKVQVIIGRDGTVLEARYESGPALLQGAAIVAVRRWRFVPTLLNGEAVEVVTFVEVPFKLR